MDESYELIDGGRVPIKAWTRGVLVENAAKVQLRYTSQLPIVWPHLAVMPDVHRGYGSTVGSVIPTVEAIIPAAVGVDIGCGMVAARTTLTSHDIGDNARAIFEAVSGAVPHGRTDNGGSNDVGAWREPPAEVAAAWAVLSESFERIAAKHRVDTRRQVTQLGTLGGGNHFIEVCLDTEDCVWVMLHSGSRGIGARIGTRFVEIAKKEMERLGVHLPDREMSYLSEGTEHLPDYMEAVGWAQDYARVNRQLMLDRTFGALHQAGMPKFEVTGEVVNCHHNYVQKEQHFGREVYLTRKGAVSARVGEMGIIPGSMGAKSFIVRGRGNPESFHTCSHGAGRTMSRTAARQQITLQQHREDTAHVVCSKDKDVIDESPRAYKPVDDVMAAQSDLVEIVHTLRQFVCVKGLSDDDENRSRRRQKRKEINRQTRHDRGWMHTEWDEEPKP